MQVPAYVQCTVAVRTYSTVYHTFNIRFFGMEHEILTWNFRSTCSVFDAFLSYGTSVEKALNILKDFTHFLVRLYVNLISVGLDLIESIECPFICGGLFPVLYYIQHWSYHTQYCTYTVCTGTYVCTCNVTKSKMYGFRNTVRYRWPLFCQPSLIMTNVLQVRVIRCAISLSGTEAKRVT